VQRPAANEPEADGPRGNGSPDDRGADWLAAATDPGRAWHGMAWDDAARALETAPDRGLSDAEAGARRERAGPNLLPAAPPPHPLVQLAAQFADPLVAALLVAAVVATGVAITERGDEPAWLKYADPLAILLIVVVNALLGFVQERRAEAALDALRRMASPRARVERNGRRREIDAADLVPGDLVVLEAGDAVPADVRLVEAVDLATQEASLTGESTLVTKDASAVLPADAGVGDRANMAFLGTAVARGRATGLVARTGPHTEFGRIGTLVQSSSRVPTPLEERLAAFGHAILVICLAISALLFVVGLVQGGAWPVMLLTAVSLAVAAIPEGLPAITTITLALGTQRMARRGAIVRKLPAVETLGSARVVCTDKTGTLTQNAMTVRVVETATGTYRVTGEAGPGTGRIEAEDAPSAGEGPDDAALRALLEAGVLASTARLSPAASDGAGESGDDAGGTGVIGDPTEGALLVLAAKAGVRREDLLTGGRTVARELPFDGERKRMSVLLAPKPGAQADLLLVKGSPDGILARSVRRVTADGGVVPLTDEERAALSARNDDLAAGAYRVLALARRPPDPSSSTGPGQADPDTLEQDLELLGLVAMIDPPRPEVRAAVAQTQRAGIRVVMITGDHALTGVAIARELGFWHEGDLAVSGAELGAMDDRELEGRIDRVAVFARVSAEQKLRIVRAFRRIGWVAAMTGDGVNDAPALREAPIGVAMGRAGTDVAREAADMVLADDNFATIVEAIREGRAIFRNIQKFVFFLNSSNAGLVLAVLVGAAFLPGLPQLTPLQLLWVNLVTNGLPALALGVDPPAPGQMDEPPQRSLEPIVGKLELGGLAVVGTLMGGLALGFLALPDLDPSWFPGADRATQELAARTMAFSVLAISPLFHAFNCRSRQRSIFELAPFGNRALWGAVAISLGVHLLAVLWPPLQPVFRTVPLSPAQWGLVVLAGAAPLPVVEVLKFGLRRAVRSP